MEGPNSSGIAPGSAVTFTHEEMYENATILDEGIRLCPLCTSEVRLFFINFNEKILMCENVKCEYPFGHESVVYVKENNEVQTDEEVVSIRSRTVKSSPPGTLSLVSTSAWSEIDKMNRVYEAEEQLEHRPETRDYYMHRKATKKARKKDIEDLGPMHEKLKVMKQLSKELIHSEEEQFVKPQIKNERWIKNLMIKEKESGVSLLQPDEIKFINTKQPDIGFGELKIDIDVGNESKMSSVKIEIMNSKD